MKKGGEIYVGTANIVIPGSKKSFPEEFSNRSRLHYYSHLFNSVEINSCFYKIPMQSTFSKWSADVTDNFKFSVKLIRDVTHAKELQCDFGSLEKFMTVAAGIDNKKGCMLIQFPGKIGLNYFNGLEDILSRIRSLDTEHEWKIAVEFRNPDWYVRETQELLEQFSAVIVVQDMRKARWMEPVSTDPFLYMRFHGPAGDYRGSYDEIYLKERAEWVKQWSKEGKPVYAYFNNTIGDGFGNARTFKRLLENAE